MAKLSSRSSKNEITLEQQEAARFSALGLTCLIAGITTAVIVSILIGRVL